MTRRKSNVSVLCVCECVCVCPCMCPTLSGAPHLSFSPPFRLTNFFSVLFGPSLPSSAFLFFLFSLDTCHSRVDVNGWAAVCVYVCMCVGGLLSPPPSSLITSRLLAHPCRTLQPALCINGVCALPFFPVCFVCVCVYASSWRGGALRHRTRLEVSLPLVGDGEPFLPLCHSILCLPRLCRRIHNPPPLHDHPSHRPTHTPTCELVPLYVCLCVCAPVCT